MRIIRCDRCLKEIRPELLNKIGYISLSWRQLGTEDLDGHNPFEHCDFCPECMQEIKEFIKTCPPILTPVPEPEPELEEPEEDEDPESVGQEEEEGRCFEAAPDPEPPKEYKGVNLRMLREMVKEGRSAKEIADALGCSVAMYYKHRKRAEELWNKGLL